VGDIVPVMPYLSRLEGDWAGISRLNAAAIVLSTSAIA
jgi:hypothetical protein